MRKSCGTHWLDPAPAPEELGTLYLNYTTHTKPKPQPAKPQTLFRKLVGAIRSSVQAKLGYPTSLPQGITRLLRIAARLHPGWYDLKLNELFYVPFVPDGKFLDVGCGSGSALAALQARGWHVRGIDFDSAAVAVAKLQGFDVSVGSLAEHHFQDNTFDALLMSHVIEHVPDPIADLSECRRVLKPGGYLIVITPNAASRGHKKYGKYWRGLEVPRHLQIFTPASLAAAAQKAGFQDVTGTTCMQGIHYLPDASEACVKTGRFDLPPETRISRLRNMVRLYFAGLRFTFFPGSEETILLRGRKESV